MKLSAKTLFTALLLSHNVSGSIATRVNDQVLANVESHAPPAMIEKVKTFRDAFLRWKREHEKVYSSIEHEVKRMMVWIENHEYIENHNTKTPAATYTVGHNFYSDMTNDEFQKYHRLGKYSPGKEVIEQKLKERTAMKKLKPDEPAQVEFRYLMEKSRRLEREALEDEKEEKKRGPLSFFDDFFNDDYSDDETPADDDAAETDDDAATDDAATDDAAETDDTADNDDNDTDGFPDEIDWVASGAVTPVKNQGNCGSCWAFSTTGSIEGAHFIATGELVALSEQNIMDCDTMDHACEGGLMENAFEFEETQNGLCTEDDYPYLATDDSECDNSCDKVAHSQVKSYIDIPAGDKHGLIASIVMQPTSIAMDAGALAFQFYSSGVLNDDSCGADGAIDHGVLAVGYGHDEDSGLDYFRVKNSWGDSWGEDGYFRLKRHSPNEYGTCAILAYMTAPVLS